MELGSCPFPAQPRRDNVPNNRIRNEELAAYALTRYRAEDWLGWGETQILHLGVRHDRHTA